MQDSYGFILVQIFMASIYFELWQILFKKKNVHTAEIQNLYLTIRKLFLASSLFGQIYQWIWVGVHIINKLLLALLTFSGQPLNE